MADVGLASEELLRSVVAIPIAVKVMIGAYLGFQREI
jgi:hypothetical protein